jgi:hypothetical protein
VSPPDLPAWAERRWNLEAPTGPAWLRSPAERGTGGWTSLVLLVAAVAVAITLPAPMPGHPDALVRAATHARRQELRVARTELAALALLPEIGGTGRRRNDLRALVAGRRLHASGQLRDLAVAEVELRVAALELDALTRVSTSGGDDAAWTRVRARLDALDLQEPAPHGP